MKPSLYSISTFLIGCTLLAAAAAAQSGDCRGENVNNCFLLWAEAADIPTIAAVHGLTVLETLDANTPDVVVVNGPGNIPEETVLEDVQSNPDVLNFELLAFTTVTEAAKGIDLNQSYATVLESLDDFGEHAGPMLEEFTASLWTGYADQPAISLIGLHAAHAYKDSVREELEPYGYGVVAVIDTGVDPDHPVLQDALVPGYDFILDQPGIASEWNGLDPATAAATKSDLEMIADQSYATVLEGNGDAEFVNPSLGPILDQSYATVLENQTLPDAFGHGTMVAGLVRLVAPGAQIMPIRVFNGDGKANTFDVARAIRWAADNGAHVINMSFSTLVASPELMRAINYAHRKGAVCVGAAGNFGERQLRYPAAFGNTIGVTATDKQDNLSPFSNLGSDVAHLASPGEGVISTYPGGGYAAGWGTSFSTALVSGTVALLHETKKAGKKFEFYPTDFSRASFALGGSAFEPAPNPDWGNGRLDIRATVENRVNMPSKMKESQ